MVIWSYNTLLFVLEASGTSVACYEAPNFVDFTMEVGKDFTLFNWVELVECTFKAQRQKRNLSREGATTARPSKQNGS